MLTLLSTIFFAGVLFAAVSVIVATLRPKLGRIGFLLRYGPVIGAELPAYRRPLPRRRAGVPVPVNGAVRVRASA